jgi:exosortase/archaeosortase family protein
VRGGWPLRRCGAGELPNWLWLVLPALALWPVWQWSVARMRDGSDDPLGIVALLSLLLLVWRERQQFLAVPRRAWLCSALLLSALVGFAQPWLAPLLRAVVAVLAMLCCLLALRQPGQALLAWLGLGLLALPILASLQFYLGYPLRLVTAEVTAWLLSGAGHEVFRQGSALQIDGQLVMVDAPCSGIQMAWVAYFTAFVTAAWLRLSDRQLLRRIPLLGVLVLSGNILRNSILVLQETGQLGWPAWMHEGTGLLVFIGVCLLVLRYVAAAAELPAVVTSVPAVAVTPRTNGGVQSPLFAALFVVVAVWPLLTARPVAALARQSFIEWPQQFAGQPLQPLALSRVEQRFAAQFPGAIGRFRAGNKMLTLRHVTAATRKLHPAADCYRGLGFQIEAIALEQRLDSAGLQRCFIARGVGAAQRVCEYIEDAAGQSFSDTSAWYWAAQLGRSSGPWRAVTVAQWL